MIYKDEIEDSIDKNYGTNYQNYPQNIVVLKTLNQHIPAI